MVLADSRKDDTLGKSIEARSKTHAVSDGATRLVTNLKALHTQANAKKAASSADMSAITSALDISKVMCQRPPRLSRGSSSREWATVVCIPASSPL